MLDQGCGSASRLSVTLLKERLAVEGAVGPAVAGVDWVDSLGPWGSRSGNHTESTGRIPTWRFEETVSSLKVEGTD